MILQDVCVTHLFSILIVVSILASCSLACNQSCEAVTGNKIKVPYPFGFSSGCEIQLNCSENGDIRIGEYMVKNVTADHILVDLPGECNRGINDLEKFYSDHFAVTSRNSLLLYNCTGPPSNCMIPTSAVKSKLRLQGCDHVISSSDNITCFSDDDGSEFLDYATVRNDCSVLLSSIVVDADSFNLSSSAVALEFLTVELGWWLVGECSCDVNAVCTNFSIPNGNGGKGYRCRCNQGFIGDGFAAGVGCQKDDCSTPNYMSGRCGGTTRVGVLIGGIIAGALLVAAVGVIWYCVHRQSRSLKNQTSAKHLLSEAAGNSSVPFISYKEIERATNGFSEKGRLGTGAYGTVYAGKLHNDEWVAIKKIKHPESVQQVMNEIKLLSSVSHPNLVRLLGCCLENGEQILVYEYMANGTLSQHLQREKGPGLPWTVRLTIAAETARAIAHLHTEMNPPIYHRDIKSSNILLDYNFNSKVADFGLSIFGIMDDSHISTAPQGTPGYVDPQYHQNYHLSDKSDVYSLGVVLLEIITALKVVDFSRTHSEINLAALAIDRIGKGRVDEIVDPFLEPNRDAWTLSSIHRVAELAFRCLAFHRDMRPSMIEVADELEQIKLSGWATLEENIGMASSVASNCSSPYAASEISLSSTITKKTGVGSKRSIVPNKAADSLPTMEESKDSSPVSVQDPWLSEQNSPSSNSLLGNVVR